MTHHDPKMFTFGQRVCFINKNWLVAICTFPAVAICTPDLWEEDYHILIRKKLNGDQDDLKKFCLWNLLKPTDKVLK